MKVYRLTIVVELLFHAKRQQTEWTYSHSIGDGTQDEEAREGRNVRNGYSLSMCMVCDCDTWKFITVLRESYDSDKYRKQANTYNSMRTMLDNDANDDDLWWEGVSITADVRPATSAIMWWSNAKLFLKNLQTCVLDDVHVCFTIHP